MKEKDLEYLGGIILDDLSPTTTLAYGFGLLYVLYQILVYFNIPLLSPREVLWNVFVYVIPGRLLQGQAGKLDSSSKMYPQTHAAKSEALRRALGWAGGFSLLDKLPGESFLRRPSGLTDPSTSSQAPPGLGNWDNSCYQNSILQGLASLSSLVPFLRLVTDEANGSEATGASLLETVTKLNNSDNNGKQLWTPAQLKSMSSWQQQDAQEYFSKIMDELGKEAAKSFTGSTHKGGLEMILEESEASPNTEQRQNPDLCALDNPLEGMIAQRVACTKCGFSEGISMIPFNCITVPLGSSWQYNLEDCLDDYTKLEDIQDVECAKCTLLRWEDKLSKMVPATSQHSEVMSEPAIDAKILGLPTELRVQAFQRLNAIQSALRMDDFSDQVLRDACQIPKSGRVLSTKTRQAVVGRPPRSLAIHVNRSVFDELTGMQRKNYASVRYPLTLNLKPWMLDCHGSGNMAGSGSSTATAAGASLRTDLTDDDSRSTYRLKAVVTHFGRHESGHYICYRKHSPRVDDCGVDDEMEAGGQISLAKKQDAEERWWCLSDEDVSPVAEEDVLNQGGVFMLFYERDELPMSKHLRAAATTAFNHAVVEASVAVKAGDSTIAQVRLNDGQQKIDSFNTMSIKPAAMSVELPAKTPAIPRTSVSLPEGTPVASKENEFTSSKAPDLPNLPPMRTATDRQTPRVSFGEKGNGFSSTSLRAVTAT